MRLWRRQRSWRQVAAEWESAPVINPTGSPVRASRRAVVPSEGKVLSGRVAGWWVA